MTNLKNILLWSWIALISLLFIWLRLYRIETSLLLRNNLGKDLFVLQTWQNSHQLPLLGPNSNLIPFSQSAWYYYILYPAYYLSEGSPFSTIYGGVIFCLLIWMVSFILAKSQKKLIFPLSLFWLMITFHPLFIQQSRYLSNNSFVLPLLILATISFLNLQKSFTLINKTVFGISLSLAIGMSFTAIIPALSFLILGILIFRKKFIGLMSFFLIGLLFTFLPNLINLITKTFPITVNEYGVVPTGMHFQAINNSKIILETILLNIEIKLMVLITIVVLLLLSIKLSSKKSKSKLIKLKLVQILILLITNFIILILLPISIKQYFIYGSITFFIFAVSLMEKNLAIIGSGLLLIFWIRPQQINSYFVTAPNTVTQLESCIKNICKEYPNPIFVTVQSSQPSHTDPSFEFMMIRQGCQVKQIAVDSNASDRMVVFADQVKYAHHQTRFKELDLFGESLLNKKYECPGNLSAYVIEKNKDRIEIPQNNDL